MGMCMVLFCVPMSTSVRVRALIRNWQSSRHAKAQFSLENQNLSNDKVENVNSKDSLAGLEIARKSI